MVNLNSLECVARASIQARHTSLQLSTTASADRRGFYTLPPLPPGEYELSATADGYQPAVMHHIELPVSGRVELNFELRMLRRAWEGTNSGRAYFGSGYVVDFYGPDIALLSRYVDPPRPTAGTLESTASYVIEPEQLRDLPFQGRDAYTMLVMLPGVSADAPTARGLGLSVNGQRSYSTQFLLDGVGANNQLISGPLLSVPPEAIQEYRISTNNWSAEFGGTSGVIANAVTRAGGNEWHGLGYLNIKNDVLNASDFQDNLSGWGRRPEKEIQPGLSLGGPILRQRLFLSNSIELFRARGRQAPQTFLLPSTAFAQFYTAPDSAARNLLERFPAPAVTDGVRPSAEWIAEPPVTLNRLLSLQRVDWIGARHRLLGRVADTKISRPDFSWTPYKDFVTPLDQNALGLAVNVTSTLGPALYHELRTGWSDGRIEWDRPHPEVPTLSVSEGVSLPGSLIAYSFRDRSRNFEVSSHWIWSQARHTLKFGGALLTRDIDGYLTAGRDGRYTFGTIVDFGIGVPSSWSVAVARASLPALVLPVYERSYREYQRSFFAQDTVRLASRLTLNAGLRVENFGSPSASNQDGVFVMGNGNTPTDQIRLAHLLFGQTGDAIYPPLWNWAPRAGISWAITKSGDTILRAAAGVFHDRVFDNLWENVRINSIAVRTFPYLAGPQSFLDSVAQLLPAYAGIPAADDFPGLTAFSPRWRTPRSISFLAGLSRRIGYGWTLEANWFHAVGRDLLVTDQVNRPFSLAAEDAGSDNPGRYLNAAVPQIALRSTVGESDYQALLLTASYRSARHQLRAAYTWSHSMDNQSDPLAADFFDLDFTRTRALNDRRIAAFSRQFDAAVDRGNSDFDQRHNLVLISIHDLPTWRSRLGRWLGRWQLSQLAGFRSGFPFTVWANTAAPIEGGAILNNRADVAGPVSIERLATPGGLRLLTAASFAQPTDGELGNLGRNALRSPGFFNVDAAISRTGRVAWLGEAGAFTLRVDVFNVLNHANLGIPDATLSSPGFGIAAYGRQGTASGFPALAPFQETGRQLQIILRLTF